MDLQATLAGSFTFTTWTPAPYEEQRCPIWSLGLLALRRATHRSYETDTAHTRGFGLAARCFAAVAHARLAARRYYAAGLVRVLWLFWLSWGVAGRLGLQGGKGGWQSEAVLIIKVLYYFHQNNDDSKCEVVHTSLPIRP